MRVYVKGRTAPHMFTDATTKIEGNVLMVICGPKVGEKNPHSTQSSKFWTAGAVEVLGLFALGQIVAVIMTDDDDDLAHPVGRPR